MKITTQFCSVFIFLIIPGIIICQNENTFKHPTLNFSFTAVGEWKENKYHDDKLIYEVVNIENEIHVMLWYNGGTEMNCKKYLLKMADMNGFKFDNQINRINNDIWVLECNGDLSEVPEIKIIAAMSHPKFYDINAPERCQGKSYNAIHIAQIWCPQSKYKANKEQIDNILASLILAK